MVELRDFLELIIMDNNDPIYIFDEDNKMYEYGRDDISNVLFHSIDKITVFDGMVEICVKRSIDIEIDDLLDEVLYED